jgi:hypothetical protein
LVDALDSTLGHPRATLDTIAIRHDDESPG